MKRIFRVAALLMCIALVAFDKPAAPPTTQPESTAEMQRLARGTALRSILLDTLEDAYAHDGAWPLHPVSTPDSHVVYIRPDKHPSVGYFSHETACTVVLQEAHDIGPGTWVGYADGHLEYAADAATLNQCLNQLPMVRDAIKAEAAANAATQPAAVRPSTQPCGQLKIKLLDPDGNAVAGATVGVFGTFGDLFPKAKPCRFYGQPDSLTTDTAGETTIPATSAFGAKFDDQPTVPLWILHSARGLCAMEVIQRSDFLNGNLRTIQMHKGCRVSGQVTCLGRAAAKPITTTIGNIQLPGKDRYYTLTLAFKGTRFDAILPPGDYGLDAYADTGTAFRFIRIDPKRETLDLNLDLPPQTVDSMVGHPAPELREIKAWKNGGPATLASLRGKVVILDFWGYWCNPCCEAMPALMKLHDQFKDRGLVIIAVHTDSVASIAEMDEKLEKTRREMWAGRDLPFLVALDGGGSRRIQYTSHYTDGATTAVYGILSWPTTLVIDKEGNLVGDLEDEPAKANEQIRKLLDAPMAVLK